MGCDLPLKSIHLTARRKEWEGGDPQYWCKGPRKAGGKGYIWGVAQRATSSLSSMSLLPCFCTTRAHKTSSLSVLALRASVLSRKEKQHRALCLSLRLSALNSNNTKCSMNNAFRPTIIIRKASQGRELSSSLSPHSLVLTKEWESPCVHHCCAAS